MFLDWISEINLLQHNPGIYCCFIINISYKYINIIVELKNYKKNVLNILCFVIIN